MKDTLTLADLKIVMAACKPIDRKLIVMNDEDLKEMMKKDPVLFANVYFCDVKGSNLIHPGTAYVIDVLETPLGSVGLDFRSFEPQNPSSEPL